MRSGLYGSLCLTTKCFAALGVNLPCAHTHTHTGARVLAAQSVLCAYSHAAYGNHARYAPL